MFGGRIHQQRLASLLEEHEQHILRIESSKTIQDHQTAPELVFELRIALKFVLGQLQPVDALFGKIDLQFFRLVVD